MDLEKPAIKKPLFAKLTIHKLSILEWVSVFLSIWLMLFPYPYFLLFSIVLILPIFGMFYHGINNPSLVSLVSISPRSVVDKYDLADYIDLPVYAIFFRVIMDFKFEYYSSLSKVCFVAFILFIIILIYTHKIIEPGIPKRILIYITIIFHIALYSYSATYGINCLYDFSEPKIYTTTVIDKKIEKRKTKHGHRTIYVITIKPWGNHYREEDLEISKKRFNNTTIGQNVKMDLKKGLFNIPWYYLEKG